MKQPLSTDDRQATALLAEDVAKKIRGEHLKKHIPVPKVITGPAGIRIAESYYPDAKRLDPLRGVYLVFLSSDGRNVIVLACDRESGEKLFEDTTATTAIDVRSWETGPQACEPSLFAPGQAE